MLVKPLEIELDKPRKFMLDLNAFALVEETLDMDFMDALEKSARSARTLRAVLWAGLRKDDPTLTLEQVGEMISISNMEIISDAINKAMLSQMPESSPEDAPLVTPPASG